MLFKVCFGKADDESAQFKRELEATSIFAIIQLLQDEMPKDCDVLFIVKSDTIPQDEWDVMPVETQQ